MPRLANLRYYDLRHQSITEMLEAGIPEGVIREVAGHVDPAMTRHYSHPRLAARKAAVGGPEHRSTTTGRRPVSWGLRHKSRHKAGSGTDSGRPTH